MAQCKWCDKKGIFVSVNKYSLCSQCASNLKTEVISTSTSIEVSDTLIEHTMDIAILLSRTNELIKDLSIFLKYDKKDIRVFDNPVSQVITDRLNKSNLRFLEIAKLKFREQEKKIEAAKTIKLKQNIIDKFVNEVSTYKSYVNNNSENFEYCITQIDDVIKEIKGKAVNMPVQNVSHQDLLSKNKMAVVLENKIEKELMSEFDKYEIPEIIEHIKQKRAVNQSISDKNFEKADALTEKFFDAKISQSSFDKGYENLTKNVRLLTDKDVLFFFDVAEKAQQEEKNENLVRASELYWLNIYHNGTALTWNFDRLLILLRKMKEYKTELKVAQLYQYFNPSENLNKRISVIEKKINSELKE